MSVESGKQATYAAGQGLVVFNGADQFDSLYPIIAQRNFPAGIPQSRFQDFADDVTAQLKYRGLIYNKKVPGDCGSPPGTPGFSNSQIVGLSGQAASLSVEGLGAVGALSGAATFGIGAAITVAVAGISEIFQHHDQAVANEQRTICSVVVYFNDALQKIDAAVSAGTITPGEAITLLSQLVNQAKSGLKSIEKVCNASCWFQGFLSAHLDFGRQFYPSIAPNTGALRPGQAPTAFGSLPGGVPSTANNVAPAPPLRSVYGINPVPIGSLVRSGSDNYPIDLVPVSGTTRSVAVQSQRTPTGQSGKLADVPPTTPSLGVGFLVVSAIIVFLLLGGKTVAA